MLSRPQQRLALVLLFLGASGIGFAPIFVRLSQVGPSATAFYRIFLALPLLWIWMIGERSRQEPPFGKSRFCVPRGRTLSWLVVCAGFFFAADLAIWHWSIQLTTVANSTLLANLAPFFVMLGARILLAERISVQVSVGMVTAFIGAGLLVVTRLEFSKADILGDLLAVVAAVFYGGYLLAVKQLRRSYSTATIMSWSGLFSCPILLLIAAASQEHLLPSSREAWFTVAALAIISHIGGQGLIAYSLAHLPASFSAVSLLWQPVMAAMLAWWLLGETLSGWQIAGGFLVMAGIALSARPTRNRLNNSSSSSELDDSPAPVADNEGAH